MTNGNRVSDFLKRLNPVLTVSILSAFFLLVFLFWNGRALFHRPSSPSTSVLLHVQPGSTFRSVVFEMNRLGITRYPETLIFWGDLLGIDTNIFAGIYEVSPEMSPFRILTDLHNGQKYFYRLTIPEGFTLVQVVRRMARLGIGSEDGILDLARNPSFLKTLGVPSQTLEGYLFPDTYYLPKITTPKDVFQMMVSRFWSKMNALRKVGSDPALSSVQEIVTLASIVQKETGNSGDMPVVAGIFLNRIQRRMKLQSDPTVIYALNGRRKLHARDMSVDSPYNTYKYSGLPPTPICNPGKEALLAVMNPKKVSYLYFISNGHGGQIYSETLKEQDAAIRKVFRNRSKE
ncbi:MAG: endolytic transglycosylase MltG [Leptospirales bacterium]